MNFFKYNKVILFSLFNLLIFNITELRSALKTVVLIDNVVKAFDTKTSCAVDLWANKFTNACKCCLVKYAPELGLSKSPTEIISICTDPKRKRCDLRIINDLEKENHLDNIKSSDEKIKKLIDVLYQKTVIVKEIHPHNVTFNSNGHFSEKSVADFLVKAYKDKKLLNSDFQSIDCLKVKDIMTQKGYATLQLFTITSTCGSKTNEYILKEMASGTGEIILLEKSYIVKALEPYIYPKHVPNFPSFIFPIAYISYLYNNKPHYLSLLDKAPGILLSDVIKEYKANKVNKEEVGNIYYNVGFNFSNYHKAMMKYFKDSANSSVLLNPTYIHGDAHQANVFYDRGNNLVVFIDNERIAKAPKDPFIDIAYIIFMTYKLFTPSDIKSDKNFMSQWLTLTLEKLLAGYIEAYPKDLRPQLLKELINKLRSNQPYWDLSNIYSDHKKVIEDVIKLLSNTYSK